VSKVSDRRKILAVLLAVVLLAGLAGCGQSTTGSGAQTTGGELKGKMTISGAWALYPMMVRWAEEFQKVHPGVQFDISAGGAGKGMTDALAGAVDIGMVSRAITPEEEAKGAFWVPVVKDAVFVAVNEKNPVWEDLHAKGLTKEAFIGIYITGEITTWGQAVGRPDVTDPIHVYTRSDACGAAETWAKYLGGTQEDLKGIAVYGDPGLLEAVVKDTLGIGFNNLNYLFDLSTGLPVPGARAASIDANGNNVADPEELVDTKEQAVTAVASGNYPSPPARDENLVTNGKPAEGSLAKAFILWILADGQNFVGEAGYIALPQEQMSGVLEKLK
jgi:phosphate transport system substrate-binding protein